MQIQKLDSLLSISDVKFFTEKYGVRSYYLWKLLLSSVELRFNVPNTVLLDSSLSIELKRHFHLPVMPKIKTTSYLETDNNILKYYYEYLYTKKLELIEISCLVDNGNAPIIRGTSCFEGYKNLSFAGVCHSSIPQNDWPFEENIVMGIAKVLASVYSPYARYYFQLHGIPEGGKNVGIIMMKMLDKPVFHATAYVFPSEIRIKYFITPQPGTIYRGGRYIMINDENEAKILDSEFGKYLKIWKHTFAVLKKLPVCIYNENLPVDVEFLITQDCYDLELYIVQIRLLSKIHIENYQMSKISLNTQSKSIKSILIPNSYLYHSVINCFSKINFSESFNENLNKKFITTFIIDYRLGEGLFTFISSIPIILESKIGLIITHPNERSHDHLQYSVYEDERIEFIIHVNENLICNLKNDMVIHIISNGNEAIIEY